MLRLSVGRKLPILPCYALAADHRILCLAPGSFQPATSGARNEKGCSHGFRNHCPDRCCKPVAHGRRDEQEGECLGGKAIIPGSDASLTKGAPPVLSRFLDSCFLP
ncbi:hypothetical protein LZ30DRAFT_717308, partial [Colletotrichum cereale]